ncbi:MAG: 23S rRNA (adenine(2503)-C(2))-methyltransferase RlmN [Pseudomonadota bacterium]|nr:23S rRNA (adenine(2503)-C(2))-methyltransferase RlmN [Pseudomonadota bacterium]
MPSIFNYTRQALGQLLNDWGHSPFRSKQIFHWIYHRNCIDFSLMDNIPKTLRCLLNDRLSTALPAIKHESESECGTIKWLFDTGAGNAIETVYIPESNRGTLCVSSQVGCALACQFCATGLSGFMRNLSTAEILTQVWHARHMIQTRFKNARPITNVVFMGMGEPLLNERNVFDAVDILLDDHAFGLSKYRVTVSTSGIVPSIKRLIKHCQAALAVSLHSAIPTTRDYLVPINKKHTLTQLMEACDLYTQTTNRGITYEYVMLDQLNDTLVEAKAVANLLKNRKAKVNLIPYNTVSGLELTPSTDYSITTFQQHLQQHGIVTTVRKTRGQKIDAACGQLYGQVIDRKKSIQSYQFKSSTDIPN